MSITGKPEDSPLRVGLPLADTIGGLTAAMAVRQQRRINSHAGQMIDVAMLDPVLATMGWVVSNHLIGGVLAAHSKAMRMSPLPCQGHFLVTADGLINIAANEDKQWQALIAHLGCPHLAEDDRYSSRENRKHRQALTAEL